MMPELTKVIAVVFGGLTVIVALWTAALATIGFPLFWKLLARLREAPSTPFAGTFTTHTHFTDNIVRIGLNYQFHWSGYGTMSAFDVCFEG
jgi:hypothetical protein